MNGIAIQLPNEAIAAFCRKWKIVEFALFGSVLTEQFRPDSDIDVLVKFAPDHQWSLLDHVTMQDELTDLFGRKVDLASRAGIEQSQNYLRRDAILGSARIIYDAA
jgi:predicted nucleotidyltransferase